MEIKDLIAKHLSGNCTAEEAEQLNNWRKLPENEALYKMYGDLWQLTSIPLLHKAPDTIDALQRFRKEREALALRKKRLRFSLASIASLAAAAILLLISSPGLLLGAPGHGMAAQELLTATTLISGSELSEFCLPDSTIVTLNRNSRLTVYEREGDRRVSLKGEAFFRVRPDKHHPFFVFAGRSVIKVLGTVFSVKTTGNGTANVEVISGSVEFSPDKGTSTVLLTGNSSGGYFAGDTKSAGSGGNWWSQIPQRLKKIFKRSSKKSRAL